MNYLSKFLPRLSEVAQPLRELTAKEAQYLKSPQREAAFTATTLYWSFMTLKLKLPYSVMRTSMVSELPYSKMVSQSHLRYALCHAQIGTMHKLKKNVSQLSSVVSNLTNT